MNKNKKVLFSCQMMIWIEDSLNKLCESQIHRFFLEEVKVEHGDICLLKFRSLVGLFVVECTFWPASGGRKNITFQFGRINMVGNPSMLWLVKVWSFQTSLRIRQHSILSPMGSEIICAENDAEWAGHYWTWLTDRFELCGSGHIDLGARGRSTLVWLTTTATRVRIFEFLGFYFVCSGTMLTLKKYSIFSNFSKKTR